MKVLSVVCARAGSKGLKNKCISKILDRMVIEYSIDYSMSLGDNVKTVVSTDIDDVITYCEKNNIEYIERDPSLCEDNIQIDHTLADAIEKKGKDCKYCSIVYGNIPTRYPEIFHEALDFLMSHDDYDAVLSMQNVEKFHPEWMFDYDTDILPQEKKGSYRRQQLPQKMIHDGHTFLFCSEPFYKKMKGELSYEKVNGYSAYGVKVKPLITDKVIIDIDTIKDLQLAEAVVSHRKNNIL